MVPLHVIIVGAGPAGLSSALSLSRIASTQPSSARPLRVTVLELRPEVTTLGGSVNLTPLALRYLDRLGVGAQLRLCGIRVRGIDLVSLRSGHELGRIWPDVDALRVKRHELVSTMLATARSGDQAQRITVRYGVKIVAVREEGAVDEPQGRAIVTLDGGEEISGDLLVGCDGLHSLIRNLYVEPNRKEVYSGKAVAYGFVPVAEPGKTALVRADGQPLVLDTAMVSGRYGTLMMTFCEPERQRAHVAAVMALREERDGSRDGWKLRASDKETVRHEILSRFSGGGLAGITPFLEKVEDWTLYPVYILPREGKWSRGRVLLLGDAAHAMPPQGESTGVAIEDGVLLGHVLSRYSTRSVGQIISDYEALRKQAIDTLWKESDWRWQGAAKEDSGWIGTIVKDWMMSTPFILSWINAKANKEFASDVETLKLPQ